MAQSKDIEILPEDPAAPDIVELLSAHLLDMKSLSPPGSVHALDLPALQAADISFFTARAKTETAELLGCAALKTLSAHAGELKSMRTSAAHLRRGVAKLLLQHIIDVARERGMRSLSLETGTPDGFAPARRLYQQFGFQECPPFGDYAVDPFSVCMTLALSASS